MELSFRSPYLSIQDFPSITLPSFTVLTGKNGSGKSHLLAAIENGSVACVIEGQQVQANQNEIRSYSWSTLVPQETAPYSSEQARNERHALWTQIHNNLNSNARINLRMQANQRGLNYIGDQQLIQSQFDEFPVENQSSQLRDFIAHRDAFLNSHEQQYRGNAVFADFMVIAKRKNKSPFLFMKKIYKVLVSQTMDLLICFNNHFLSCLVLTGIRV